jgi:hypothetical protein
MSLSVEEHVLARIAAVPIDREPFPHCIVDGVFPDEFYEGIIDHWPAEPSWRPLGNSGRVSQGSYQERRVVLMNQDGYDSLDAARRRFWQNEMGGWLAGPRLATLILEKFAALLSDSGFSAALDDVAGDALIVSDRTHYAIGPHTDAPHRVASLLFYLPEDATFQRFGTRFYAPLDPQFRCRGGPHYAFHHFRAAKIIDFVPNRLVAFPKSDRCFHGVEEVDLPGIDRRLLIYNLRRRG